MTQDTPSTACFESPCNSLMLSSSGEETTCSGRRARSAGAAVTAQFLVSFYTAFIPHKFMHWLPSESPLQFII